MRKCCLICLFCALLPLVGGCDFFRKVAKRPVSSEIEAKREYIDAQNAFLDSVNRNRRQASMDSMEIAQKHMSDSARAWETIDSLGIKVITPSVPLMPDSDFRYAIVVGTFSQPANADRLASGARAEGFVSEVVSNGTGRFTVLLCPCSGIVEVVSKYMELMSFDFFPGDAWIMDAR